VNLLPHPGHHARVRHKAGRAHSFSANALRDKYWAWLCISSVTMLMSAKELGVPCSSADAPHHPGQHVHACQMECWARIISLQRHPGMLTTECACRELHLCGTPPNVMMQGSQKCREQSIVILEQSSAHACPCCPHAGQWNIPTFEILLARSSSLVFFALLGSFIQGVNPLGKRCALPC
jgi:hypothetical protein